MFNRKLVFALVVSVVVLYLLNFRLTTGKKPYSGKWTVYGTMGCGWTRKQLKHMKDNNISHEFIDCDKKDCGDRLNVCLGPVFVLFSLAMGRLPFALQLGRMGAICENGVF